MCPLAPTCCSGVCLMVGAHRGWGSPRVGVPPFPGQGAPSTHLLQRGVLDSVGIVMIVDDLEVGDSWARPRPHELHIQGGLPCPPRLHAEVGGGPHLHPCDIMKSLQDPQHPQHPQSLPHSTQRWVEVPTSTSAPHGQPLRDPWPYLHPRTHHPHPVSPTPTHRSWTLTCPAEPRSLGFDLGGIVGWVHLDAEGAGGDLLGTETRTQ